MLSIRLLGSPQITLNGQPIHIPRRKSRALLYYLAAHMRPLTREHLLTFFWPDADRASGQQVLRTTLHGLRKALGSALLAADETIALAPDSDVDVRQFDAQLQSPSSNIQSLSTTLDLYRGDFLSDFSLPDSPEFDDWAAVERERYRRLFVRGQRALSQLHEAQGDYPAALAALERALAVEPLQEDVQRVALRLHYLAGDRAGAIRRYESFRKLLDDEMGVPPLAETRALYDAIITDTLEIPNPVRSTSPSPISKLQPPILRLRSGQASSTLPFTGRAAELQALREAAASHKLALIAGEPGIGKTRLVEEFIRAADAWALIGRARELEHALPYQPIVAALRHGLNQIDWPSLRSRLKLASVWLDEVAHLVPELAAPASDTTRTQADATPISVTASNESRLWEGVFQFLYALAQRRPLILFLDDVHWADSSTLALLGYLVRQAVATRAPLSFVATTRPITPRAPLATCARRSCATTA